MLRLLLTTLIVALMACSGAPAGGVSGSPSQAASVAPGSSPDPVASVGQPRTLSDDLTALADVLAPSGIATYDDSALEVLRPASGPEVLGITAFQLENMAHEARSGGGIAAGSLDALSEPLTLQLDDGSLALPLSKLIAAYVSAVESPGAVYARELMGDVDVERHAAYLYPMIVVASFVGDALVESAGSSGATGRSGPPATRFILSRGGALRGVPALAGPRVAADPCAAAQGLLNQLPGLLAQLVVPSNSGFWGAIAGAVIGTVATIAVQAAISAIQAALSQVRGVLATAAAAFYTASLLRTWSVTVASDAGEYHYRVDGGAGGGVFTATVAGGQGVNWPSWMQSCASLFGLALPQVQQAAGSAISWSPSFNGHAAGVPPADATIGAGDSASFTFETSSESGTEHAQNKEQTGAIAITAVVSRGVDAQQITALIQALFAGVPAAVANIGGAGAAAAISSLSDVSGSGSAVVKHHKGAHASIDYRAGGGRIYAYSCDGPLGVWTFKLEIADERSATTPNPVLGSFGFSDSSRTAALNFTYTTTYYSRDGDPDVVTFENDWQLSLVDGDTAIDVSGTTVFADGEAVQEIDQDPGWQQILPFQISRVDVPECAQP